MSEARINRLEVIAERHDSDIHRIADSMSKLVVQGDKTNSLLQQSIIQDERFNGRFDKIELRSINDHNSLKDAIGRAHTRLDKKDKFANGVTMTILSIIIVALAALILKSSGA